MRKNRKPGKIITLKNEKLIKELLPQEALGLDNFIDNFFQVFKAEMFFATNIVSEYKEKE